MEPVSLDPSLSYDQIVLFPDFNQAAAGDVFYFDGLSKPAQSFPQPIDPPTYFSALRFEEPAASYQLGAVGGAGAALVADPVDPSNHVLAEAGLVTRST